ncbi:MAG: NADH-quinone oxidoreductase subunit NuoB [Bdellovibrionales bacterium]|nr:NADH-quinone oxidoreductase subunit NuoB [Bdellovibrionales bacterium]
MTLKPLLRYIRVGMSCCGDDWIQTDSSRYDLERLGCMPSDTPENANLLILQGSINAKLGTEVMSFYERMARPKYVLAIGTCACGGGLFPTDMEGKVPVNVYVTGCPPRPEAIMNGVISLREVQK